MANQNRTPKRVPMDNTRKAIFAAGVLYLVTFVTSIPALPLYHDILNQPHYILGGASDTGVRISALLELLCGLTGIGTAVLLFPVLKRKSEARALGFVASRILEASMIFVGVLSVLTIVTLHKHGASGAEAASLVGNARSLVALHNWTFLIGPGIMPAVNALCFATILYQTRLVPRIIPTIGLIGAPLLFVSSMGTLFGGWDQISSTGTLMALPIAAWEFSIGVWMIVKGFKPTTVASSDPTGIVDLEPLPAGV